MLNMALSSVEAFEASNANIAWASSTAPPLKKLIALVIQSSSSGGGGFVLLSPECATWFNPATIPPVIAPCQKLPPLSSAPILP
ncbi:hypothetical protein PG291_08810 [Riemerella anatipestifer]|nr:hypothetical protein [Riemerella anatipestifer]